MEVAIYKGFANPLYELLTTVVDALGNGHRHPGGAVHINVQAGDQVAYSEPQNVCAKMEWLLSLQQKVRRTLWEAAEQL